MKGLSRWSDKGGSYRTIQRFFNTPLNRLQLNWLLIRHPLWDADDVALMSGDHVVVTKSGKTTHGLDRFFSSLYGKAVPGLCFLSLSLLSVKHRTSYPVVTEQGPTELKLRYYLTSHIYLLERDFQAVSWLFSALPLISDFVRNRHYFPVLGPSPAIFRRLLQ